MLDFFLHSGDADVSLDQVVVRLEILVRKRPVFAVAIVGSGLEVPIAEAQTNAAPNVGAASGDAQAAHPKERVIGGLGVRLLEVVDEPAVIVFATDFEDGLD